MQRVYEHLIRHHFATDRQIFFLMGPRQVGKTTSARNSAAVLGENVYLNWDNESHRRVLVAGPESLAERIGLHQLRGERPVCVLDALHKFGRWKGFLKGFYDTYGDRVRLIVTGSARLDVFKAGSDSLMGRYFGYRMHPLSVAELADPEPAPTLVRSPRALEPGLFDALLRFGGYPEPLLRQEMRFWRRWTRTRREQLFREDLRDLTQVRELGQVETLATLLRERAGQLTGFTSLARSVGASLPTVRRWLETLEALYYCFPVRPWHRNIARALRKDPKYYLWDWSQLTDEGARSENFVACALLKAVHLWTDRGEGEFALHFIRNKEKQEVDFVVVRDGRPWFLVEVKSSAAAPLSPHLRRFQEQTGASHAFQVVFDRPYVERSCFDVTTPIVVPAQTLLAQLV